MSLEEDVQKLEFYGCSNAVLFYDIVKTLLAKVGFNHAFENYFSTKDGYVGVRKCFREFNKLLSCKGDFKNITFMEVFKGLDGSKVSAVTAYPDITAFKDKLFSYYTIGSSSTLGSKLGVRCRDKLFGEDKANMVRADYNEGFLTKLGSNYFFTLMSLYKLVEESKPVLRPHYVYKC